MVHSSTPITPAGTRFLNMGQDYLKYPDLYYTTSVSTLSNYMRLVDWCCNNLRPIEQNNTQIWDYTRHNNRIVFIFVYQEHLTWFMLSNEI